MPSRIVCISVPLFPLAARLRSEPELKGEAVVVCEGNGNAARVVAASRDARKAGIRPGLTLPQARALFPKLTAKGRDLESERAAQEALLEAAYSFSPRVEDAGDGIVYFDADGLPGLAQPPGSGNVGAGVSVGEPGAASGRGLASGGRLAPAPSGGVPGSPRNPEREFGQAVILAVEKSGMPARVGIAASKLAARVAGGLPDSPNVVPPGEEARFLSPLPLNRLSPQMETAETLARWGIGSIGDLARLPEGEVASRLGELGRQLHATARGVDLRPLEPRLPPLSLTEGMELDWPLVNLEPFLFLATSALERLASRLDRQGLACTRLELTLKLDPDGHDARAIALPAPTRDVKTLLTLIRLEIEARQPGAPVTGFTFTAHPDKPRRAQLTLFGAPALSPDRVATTIARLASLLGGDRIGSPRTADGHRPDRHASSGFTPPAPPEVARPARGGRGLLAVRVLRPPVPLEVVTEEARSRLRLVSLRSAGNGDGPPHLEIQGTVRVTAGPWSLEEGWWSEAPASRDYWDVELSDGGLYRLYRERGAGGWYADGVYD